MRHEAALKRLDELDSKQGYSLALRWHLARCSICSLSETRMSAAMRAYREDAHPRGADAVSEDLIEDRIMAAVRLMPPPKQDFALGDWIFPGAVLAISMVLLPLMGKDVDFLKSLFGSGYLLSISLVLGAAFTGYCAFFIATHLSELQDYLEKRGLMPR
jgi:hypothetical protein